MRCVYRNCVRTLRTYFEYEDSKMAMAMTMMPIFHCSSKLILGLPNLFILEIIKSDFELFNLSRNENMKKPPTQGI